ncbi:3-phosphoshikimate 1-carboxyvinyltransferase [Candidatus Palibaumannia cicadellinicola]|uniref:3-phosphoshikimate 1-carboxyvinyltransferase n=1 Tax=Baumannia cicadellinicola subsp. Homalodisca coagulata TaxID=374463 RepID=AROA_BAUCH|nr:3-phosphoshikimate 1-carboxyvinyltransferase [Candidatus Baumannia cicadellinicola]Q1LTL1.1 RecName: Full=3-phosphoshikimate 1-carboxyvinyltransferase; AltName: Full=5-enolpyruvylshikimate-3-phosphate synthase; Short=EPSP synthase; Short=EPSPS [Baumannia cicadellinicola str. Hc (Homalodisca coagulata)]ABF14261.1 3-phosphoshikimate 1-carboxyvinyltransferase [Baumannia cicadellinicola str. Hc (Homalodisca coagulata)]MCJ7462314.1 3-phosphoshikimate 1-carboxyvinyltransferase [Candidatus Baumannia
MQELLTLQPIVRVNGTIHLPGSKSISNRALLLAAQALGKTCLINLLDSYDVRYMLDALHKLGINYCLSIDRRSCEIDGIGRPLRVDTALELYLGNSGIALRSLVAALCLQNKNIIITGDKRMKNRPIGHLVDALRQGSAQIHYLEKDNYPPLLLQGGFYNGDITIDCSLSSQFLTSLLMMAPLASQDRCIFVKGRLVSKPYIDMTLAMMKSFGIVVQHDQYKIFYIKGKSQYRSPGHYLVEGDATNASYFLAAAAIRGGTVRVTGVGSNSIQGDIRFADILANMGAIIRWGVNYIECTRNSLCSIDIDMNALPDTAMTIAIVALFTYNGVTTLRNIYNWRIKETNRLVAMATELRKVGAIVVEGKEYLSIKPPNMFKIAKINTYDDHRIAMCFALVALSNVSITIVNPKCTYKTFPDFFKLLKGISIT